MSKYFFCAIAGSGMSALAQMKKMEGNEVLGSDRSFDNFQNQDIRKKFELNNIKIYPQDGSGVSTDIDFFVVSTAVEETNPDYKKAKTLGIKIIHRSELLSQYLSEYQTIAVGGTSGKSTTTAMIWHILNETGYMPSVINGAYINSLVTDKLIGNAYSGKGKHLVIEADESDSTITRYKSDTALILNITKDHKSIDELKNIFSVFISNSKAAFLNEDDDNCREIARKHRNVFFFGRERLNLEIEKTNIFYSDFNLNGVKFHLPLGGYHNIENAMAAFTISRHYGVKEKEITDALSSFKGTFRRMNLIGEVEGIKVIDDYAHNPAKIEAVLKTLLNSNSRIILIYQPHGYAPARMFKKELISVFLNLRKTDVLIMPEIYYAGGTVNKDISSNDIVKEVKKTGINALFFEKRESIIPFISENARKNDIITVMGARDNSLNIFAKEIYSELLKKYSDSVLR